jgi:hypothetical protein
VGLTEEPYKYVKNCQQSIEIGAGLQTGDDFWLITPSPCSLIFSLLANTLADPLKNKIGLSGNDIFSLCSVLCGSVVKLISAVHLSVAHNLCLV